MLRREFIKSAAAGLFLPTYSWGQDRYGASIGRRPQVGTGLTVAFDAATSSTTTSFSHTCTGSNRLLILFIKTKDLSGGISATYNSVSFSASGNTADIQGTDLSLYRVYLMSLVAPASGTNTVAVTGTGLVSFITASFTDVHQTTALGTISAQTATATVSPSGYTSGDMIIGASIDTSTGTLSSSNTAIGTSTSGLLGGRRSDSGSLTWTGHADEKAVIGVVVKHA